MNKDSRNPGKTPKKHGPKRPSGPEDYESFMAGDPGFNIGNTKPGDEPVSQEHEIEATVPN